MFIEEISKAYQLPGLSIGIIENGEVIYKKGFGLQRMNSNVPVSPETVFQMGSLSKVFVATAIMQLVEQNKICLDEKLVTYLPYFRMKDERYKDVTIKQILTHTSCIPDVENFEWHKPQLDEGAAKRYIGTLQELSLMDEPGKMYYYSNRAYNILADVIHVVSGSIFETYIRENLFVPLQMTSSTFIYSEIKEELLAWPHQLNRNFRNGMREIYPYNRIHAPSSTLYSSASDMMNWIMMNFNDGVFQNTQVIGKKAHALLMEPFVRTEPDTYMCLAWKKAVRQDHILFVSLGGEPGFKSFMVLAPEKKRAVIVSCNSDTFSAEHIGLPVIFKLFGHDLPLPKTPIFFPLGRTTMEKGICEAIAEYHHLKENYPDQYDFHESHLNELAFKMLNKRRKPDIAAHLFQLSLAENAGHWWAYSGLAQAYERLGNTEHAIENYVKALDMKPDNQFLIQKLEKAGYYKNNQSSLQTQR